MQVPDKGIPHLLVLVYVKLQTYRNELFGYVSVLGVNLPGSENHSIDELSDMEKRAYSFKPSLRSTLDRPLASFLARDPGYFTSNLGR